MTAKVSNHEHPLKNQDERMENSHDYETHS